MEESIAKKSWAGDYWKEGGPIATVVAEMWKCPNLSEASGREVEWLSILYSALGSALVDANRLRPLALYHVLYCLWYMHPLTKHLRDVFSGAQVVPSAYSAEQCEVAARVLLRWADVPFLGGPEWADVAKAYAGAAISRWSDVPHTRPLAFLTMTEIFYRRGVMGEARNCVSEAKRTVSHIVDPRQKARVFRGIAYLTYCLDELNGGVIRALRAADDCIAGLPDVEDVRAKNLELWKRLCDPCTQHRR